MDDEVLIECVRGCRCLYDSADPKYLDMNYKSFIWRNIGEEIQQNDEHCKKRWANIRDQFKKTLNKRKTKGGKSAKAIKKYKYEDNLQFLLPHIQDRDTISNNEDDNKAACSSNEAEKGEEVDVKVQFLTSSTVAQPIVESMEPPSTPTLLPQPSCGCSTSLRQSNSLSTSRNHCKCRQYRHSHSIKEALPQQSGQSASNTLMRYIIEKKERSKSDIPPIDAFFLGLIPTVKRFSPYYQHLAKGRIFSVVQELEYAQLQSPGSTSALCTSPAYESSTSSSSPGVVVDTWTTALDSPPSEAPSIQTPLEKHEM